MSGFWDPIFAPIREFVRKEAGAATVDWVLLCAGATAMAMMALNMGKSSVGTYSANVRDEVQSPYFETSWTSALDIPPQEIWGEMDAITVNTDASGEGVLAGVLTNGTYR
jgi:Flp pilus assembly pilin Flp